MLSIHAALQYISKYASKAETRSAAFSEIFNEILSNSEAEDSSLSSIQKLILSSVVKRDISAQETCHLILRIPLYHSSRSFVSLNLNKETPRWICGTGSIEGEGFTRRNDVGWMIQSPLKIYWNRPVEFEEFSLFRLNLSYKFVNGR